MRFKKIIRKTKLVSKSKERIEDEKLRKPVRKALDLLRRSKILNDLSPKSPLPKGLFFSKPQLYFYTARIFASLRKHQQERRHIADQLHLYMNKLEKEEARLIKKASCINKSKIEAIEIRLRICRELLRYSQYEHKDYWKDLAYYKLYKYLKLCRKLKYDDIFSVMSKLSILYRQTSVSCKEEPTASCKFFTRFFPAYSKEGKFQVLEEKVRLPSDKKIKKTCIHFIGNVIAPSCCEKEKINITKRIARIMSPKEKGLLFYNEQKYGEIPWQGFLGERKTFTRLHKKKQLRKVPINDTEKYISEEIRHTYLKHHIDEYLLRKILMHLKLNPQEYISDLLSDKEFCQATSLHI